MTVKKTPTKRSARRSAAARALPLHKGGPHQRSKSGERQLRKRDTQRQTQDSSDEP